MHKLIPPAQDARTLTQSVVQATHMLGMYQAELARILHLTCSDIGELANARRLLAPDTESWEQAVLFIRLYNWLYDAFSGDEAAIHHWLRTNNTLLNGTPLYLIVDHGQLATVLTTVEEHHGIYSRRTHTTE